ncbi:hypothetical protein BS78_05G119000 [Paspalum vaginatum]|nr:hypothetical protein BS78_05G119000 [Paspalum vaginatum]
MLLHTVRFLRSVVAAFTRLVRELRIRKAKVTATACSPSSRGLISAMSLALLDQVVAPPPVVVVGAEVCTVVNGGEAEKQGDESMISKKKAAWPAATRRPTRLVIPVADDGAEVAAGWGAAAAPVKEADVEMEGEGFRLASRAGPRHAMEDAYAVITDKNCGDHDEPAFYGVFDGHGGRAAVDFVAERLGKNVVSAVLAAEARDEVSSSAEDAVSAAIRAAYLATDSELLAQPQGASGGACATTALLKGGELYVAHVGDCRAVLSRGGAAAALTADHTCASEEERARVERLGGYVSRSGSGVWRLQGSLAVSRAFGDAALKRWVVADPAVARVPLDAGCEFLVVATDGLWEKVGNQEAVDAVARSRETACRELVDMARRRGSRDDVTVMVVDLRGHDS